jgi:hypothetical protein
MFSAEQYRAKAAEFRALLTSMPRSPNETSELRNLEQSYTTLAENEEWMAANMGRTIQRRIHRDGRASVDEEEGRVLRCGDEAAYHAAEYCPHAAPNGS